jgi:chromosome segregation ATPase
LLELNLSAKNQALNEAQVSLVHVSGDRDLLRDRLSGLQLEKERVEEEIENLTKQKKELEDVAASYEKVTTEVKTLRLRLGCLNEEKDEVTAKLNVASASLVDAQNEIVKLSAAAKESESLRDSLESLQLERDELLAKLNAKTNALRSEVAASASDLTADEHRSAQTRFDVLQREKKQLELQLERKAIVPKVHAPSTRQRDDEALKSLKAANKRLSVEVKSLSTALKDAERKNLKLLATEAALTRTAKARDSLKEEARALLSDKQNQEKALRETEEALRSARQECESLRFTKSQVSRLQKDMQAANADMEELQAAYDNCNDSLQNLLERNADLEAEIERAQMMHQRAEDLATENENCFLEMRSNFEQAQTDCDALFNRLGELSALLERFEQERASLKSQLDQKSAALVEAEEAREAAANGANCLRQLGGKWAAERATLDSLLTEKKAEAASRADKVEEYVEQISSIQTELSDAREYLRQSEDEVSELRGRNEGLVTKCGRLREYIRKLTRKCDEWEEFHKQESHVLQQLKLSHDRTRQKAFELAEKVHEKDQVRQ